MPTSTPKITPDFHKAFFAYLGKGGSLKHEMEYQPWVRSVIGRYSLKDWLVLNKAVKGIGNATSREDAVHETVARFMLACPEWRPEGYRPAPAR